MSESMRNAIDELQRHLDDLTQQAVDTKKTINSLCRVMGEPLIYTDADLSPSPSATQASIQLNGDEYFNKPLAGVVRGILINRRERNLGPATAEEVYNQMLALHGLKISLSKNTTAFMKLPNGKFGLAEWYGKRDAKPKQNGVTATDTDEEEVSTAEDAVAAEEAVAEAPNKPR
jgi:hypothetical protein